jgi:peptidoglycan/LPS O-acetylase OafA/YrhL
VAVSAPGFKRDRMNARILTAHADVAIRRAAGRNQGLDILRAVAVLLVLFRHAYVFYKSEAEAAPFIEFLNRGGWIGVDLFFVLSGFLIAQLLFREHDRFGAISFKNFFIRRGFKIYPPYYAMAVITALILGGWNVLSFEQIFLWSFPWLFYLQDYVQNPLAFIWGHTWSLAVEEQFYVLLPLLLILLAKSNPTRTNPFRLIPAIFVFIALACLVVRISNLAVTPFDGLRHLAPFHIRIDSLFCGVFVSYLHHYHQVKFVTTMKRFGIWLLPLGLLPILPPFFMELATSRILYTFGYSLLYVGNALIMMTVLVVDPIGTGFLQKAAAYIGARSYSIYLWHFPLAWLICQPQVHSPNLSPTAFLVFYLMISIVFGIIASNIIELPMLKLRDRLYLSRSA